MKMYHSDGQPHADSEKVQGGNMAPYVPLDEFSKMYDGMVLTPPFGKQEDVKPSKPSVEETSSYRLLKEELEPVLAQVKKTIDRLEFKERLFRGQVVFASKTNDHTDHLDATVEKARAANTTSLSSKKRLDQIRTTVKDEDGDVVDSNDLQNTDAFIKKSNQQGLVTEM